MKSLINLETIQTLHGKLWQWLKDQIAQDVPDAVGLCEYDCRKQQCSEEEWASCERRIHKAAGELWPESSPQTAPRSPEDERVDSRPIHGSRYTPVSAVTGEIRASIKADDIIDVALHDEIKHRAYELYERRQDTADGQVEKDELQAELPRVAYAAAQLQKYSNGEVVDTRAVRAARVYLSALSSFIDERDHALSKPPSEPLLGYGRRRCGK